MTTFITFWLLAVVAAAAGAVLAWGVSRHRSRLRLTAWQHRCAELARRATHDPLTGALNRTGWSQQPHLHQPGWVGMLDLDRFKAINDAHGHQVGDTVLAITAGRLQAAVARLGGQAARFGGDEFALRLPAHLDPHHAGQMIVGRLRWPIRLPDGATLCITASLGLAEHPGGPIAQSLKQADTALYSAKADRDRCVLYDPGAHGSVSQPGTRPAARRREHRRPPSC